jgi:hypothetical protein
MGPIHAFAFRDAAKVGRSRVRDRLIPWVSRETLGSPARLPFAIEACVPITHGCSSEQVIDRPSQLMG